MLLSFFWCRELIAIWSFPFPFVVTGKEGGRGVQHWSALSAYDERQE
jgi:hypothetical protein